MYFFGFSKFSCTKLCLCRTVVNFYYFMPRIFTVIHLVFQKCTMITIWGSYDKSVRNDLRFSFTCGGTTYSLGTGFVEGLCRSLIFEMTNLMILCITSLTWCFTLITSLCVKKTCVLILFILCNLLVR